jgi:hypothetical protein
MRKPVDLWKTLTRSPQGPQAQQLTDQIEEFPKSNVRNFLDITHDSEVPLLFPTF